MSGDRHGMRQHIPTILAFQHGSSLPVPDDAALMAALRAGLLRFVVRGRTDGAGQETLQQSWCLTARGRKLLDAAVRGTAGTVAAPDRRDRTP